MIKQGIYQHFKGGMYEVLFIGTNSEDLSKMVVYKSLKDGSIWIRPLDMFLEQVKINGELIDRFKYIGEK